MEDSKNNELQMVNNNMINDIIYYDELHQKNIKKWIKIQKIKKLEW